MILTDEELIARFGTDTYTTIFIDRHHEASWPDDHDEITMLQEYTFDGPEKEPSILITTIRDAQWPDEEVDFVVHEVFMNYPAMKRVCKAFLARDSTKEATE